MSGGCTVLYHTGRCWGCGTNLRYNGDPRREYYCGMRCLHRVPPRLALAMHDGGFSDPRECMLATLRRTQSVEAAARALGADKQALYRWIRIHKIRREVVWA